MLKITAGHVHCMCLGICFYLFILPMIHCVYPSFYQSGICNHCLYILSLHHFIFSSDSRMPVKCARLPLSSITVYIFFFLVPVPLFQTLLQLNNFFIVSNLFSLVIDFLLLVTVYLCGFFPFILARPLFRSGFPACISKLSFIF